MSSLRRRLVLGTALVALVAVGLAATAVAVADRLLTIEAVDRELGVELRGARFRALGALAFGWNRGPRGDDERQPDDDLIVAWSTGEAGGDYRSGATPPELAAFLRARVTADGAVTLRPAAGPPLRVRRDTVRELPEGPRRWRGGEEAHQALPIVVLVAQPLDAVLADLHRRRLLLAVTVAAATALAALGAWLLARGLLRPLRALGERIAATEAAAEARPIVLTAAPAELRPVVDRLNDLLERVAAAVARERRINADIAHELRTPLAGLRSQLEFALRGEPDLAELREAAGESLAIAVQMQDLMENLLVLTRLDSGQVALQRATLHPAALVDACWRPLAPRAIARGIALDNGIDPALAVTSDAASLRLVLGNLLANAVAHGAAGGTVRVHADGHAVTIDNPAPEVPPEAAAHALEPFWRGDSARTDTGLHCGLGLSIAQRLCQAVGGELSIAIADGRFVARIALPGA